MRRFGVTVFVSAILLGCSKNHDHASSTAQPVALDQQDMSIPASAATAKARLSASPRHADWVFVKTGPTDSVRAWLVYPQSKDKAPVVVVIHEIFGLSNWVRGVADQLAADGFIAIAPDLLTAKNLSSTADGEPNPDSARAHIREIQPADYQKQIREVANYAMNLPAAKKKYGVVGYCWGGGAVFNHAAFYPDVNGVVSYYGPMTTVDFSKVKTPVLGLYGANDERVNAGIPKADSAAKAVGFTYEHHEFAGAGHGFLRAQDGANLDATKQAWPMTVAWFRKNLR
jgi:carboxymethylenebutenolidase